MRVCGRTCASVEYSGVILASGGELVPVHQVGRSHKRFIESPNAAILCKLIVRTYAVLKEKRIPFVTQLKTDFTHTSAIASLVLCV